MGRPQGDEAQIRAIYAEHSSALLAFVLHLTRDRQRAEDIVQETLLRAWRHPEALTADRGEVRPWLWTVARRLVIDDARARRARPQELPEELMREPATEDEIDRSVERWEIADALATLTPEHRAVLIETYYRGRSVTEAAHELGIPSGTVKSRAYYALRALRVSLSERGVTA